MPICNVVGLELSASLPLLAHHQDVACPSLFYRCYFGRCFSELSELVPLPHACGHSTRYSNRYSSFFPWTAKL